jgi:ribokinase
LTCKITVVGSFAAGLTMKVDRLPNCGETLLGRGYRVDYGGKGSNQAVACARLGARVSFVAKIGNDAFGESALTLYREEGIDIAHVEQVATAPTGVGFIVVEAASGDNSIVIDPGANELLTAAEVSRAASAFDSSAVVLTQLEIPVAAAQAAMTEGRSRGAITILNPAPVRPLSASILNSVDILTPNAVEAKVLAGLAPDATMAPASIARALLRLGVKQVVMTLGEKGALVVTESVTTEIPAISVNVADSTGAGDSFNAGIAMALASGATLEEAVRFAVITGGLAVRKEGVIPSLPSREDVRSFYQQKSLADPRWLSE